MVEPDDSASIPKIVEMGIEQACSPSGTAPEEPASESRPTVPAPVANDGGEGQHNVSPNTESSPNSQELTPLRAHYLKKSLVSLQFTKELKVISNPSSNPNVSILSYLGSPFTPPPKGSGEGYDLVLFRFIFRQFFLTFPFFASAPKNFFPQKLQPFIDSVLARNLTGGFQATIGGQEEEAAELGRQKFPAKVEKQLTLLIGTAIKLTEKEEVVRLSQQDLERLEELARRRRERAQTVTKDVFEINVIGVRTVVEKKTVRSRTHDEFLIRTRRSGAPDVFVARRFGDFKTLWETLRKAHPEAEVPPPPAKDRSASTTTTSYLTEAPPSATPITNTPTSATSDAFSAPNLRRTDTSTSVSSISQHRLSREKNRLTLRYYLNMLLTRPAIASSPVLRSFLTSGSIKLTQRELDDAARREEADKLREEGRKRFDNAVKERVNTLRTATHHIKADAMSKDGLSHIFGIIRRTPNVKDLPDDYKAVLEWGRVTLASTIFQNLIAADSASETFASLKRLHGLMPYMMMRGILKISNPVAMIRGFLDLFTAQPFGGKSLLQRMFSSSLTEEARALQEDIDMVADKVEDPVLCEKVKQYVYAPPEIQEFYKAEAVESNCNLLTVILRSSESPVLNRAQMQRIARSSKAHAQYLKKKDSPDYDSEDDEGPSDEEGWLYEDLGILLRLYGKLRDKEQLIGLIFESNTADLLKDIITIFYSPLAQVYKAASISDSLADLQNFINDLIATVEQVDELNDENPARTVQTFIDLVGRHEQAFYSFVYKVHTKGEGLFDSLTHWVELFITFMREGLGEDISLDFLLPHSGPERAAIFKEVDAVALYHYKLKVAHEEKVRRRFDNRAKDGVEAAEERAAQELVEGVLGDSSIGDLLSGDLQDIADDDDSEEYTTSETESSSDESESLETSTPPLPSPPPPPPKSPGGSGILRKLTSKKSLPSLPRSKSDSPPPPLPAKDAATTSRPSLRLSTDSRNHGSNSRNGTPHRPRPLQAAQSKQPAGGSSQHPTPLPTPAHFKRRKGPPPLKEPELKLIPDLLPVFIEMIRPKLRPREVAGK